MPFSVLQIGINKYGGGASLQGCVNDIYNYSSMLQKIETPIVSYRLLDSAATVKATKAAFDKAAKDAVSKRLNRVIFQYSGHGTYVRDTSGDEKSKIDGAIVPVDYARKGIILDDEIGKFADKLKPAKLIILLDSCFAGQAQRFAFLPNGVRRAFGFSTPRFLRVKGTPNTTLTTYDATRFLDINAETSVLVATSRPHETSADAYIGGKYQGAGTYSLMLAWSALGRGASYFEIQEWTNNWLRANDYDQRIMLGGSLANLKMPFMT